MGEVQHTFLFADLAGFTALTEVGQRSAAGLAVDPVCRMAVDPASAAGILRHDGTEFHFCSLECAGAFSADPSKYAGRTA